jgi:ribosomal protein S18 acetylase RimI-like enzyme
MPAIEIRPAVEADISTLIQFDHSYLTDCVWQMDLQMVDSQVNVQFREVRLPRSVRVEYPYNPKTLQEDWAERSGILVAVLKDELVGYACLMQTTAPLTTWMTDLVVTVRLRRQGIGSALVLAAQEWAAAHPDSRRLVLEIQPRNIAAIRLAQKLGFDFCGYNDTYYANNDPALFFSKWVL